MATEVNLSTGGVSMAAKNLQNLEADTKKVKIPRESVLGETFFQHSRTTKMKDRLKQKVSFSTNSGLPTTDTPLPPSRNCHRPYTNENIFVSRPLNSSMSTRSSPGYGYPGLENSGQFIYFVVKGTEQESYRDKVAKKNRRIRSLLNSSKNQQEYNDPVTKRNIEVGLDTVNGLKVELKANQRYDGYKNQKKNPPTTTKNFSRFLEKENELSALKNEIGKYSDNRKSTPMEPCRPNTIELPHIQCQIHRQDLGKALSKTCSHRIRSTNHTSRKIPKTPLPLLKRENFTGNMPRCVESKSLLIRSKPEKEIKKTAKGFKNLKKSHLIQTDEGNTERQKSSLSSSRRKNAVEMKIAKVDIVSEVYAELLKTAMCHYQQYPTIAKQKELKNLFEKIKKLNINDEESRDIDAEDCTDSKVYQMPRQQKNQQEFHNVTENAIHLDENAEAEFLIKKLTGVIDDSSKPVDSAPITQTCFRMILPIM